MPGFVCFILSGSTMKRLMRYNHIKKSEIDIARQKKSSTYQGGTFQ